MEKFITWKETKKGRNTQSVNVAEHKTREEAMQYLEEVAKKNNTKVQFEKGTEFGGEPAVWAWFVEADGARYFHTMEDEEVMSYEIW